MADFVRSSLKDIPVRVFEDDTAPKFGGTCGNLVCVPPSFTAAKPALGLFAHLDTPRSTAGVKPRLTDGRITSDGTTILGVDNRAGISALLHALRENVLSGSGGNYVVVFTVGEELGLYGSKFFDPVPYNIRLGFVFDCSKRPGTFIRSAVGCFLYTASFMGTASHAAVAPDKGVNAISIAAQAISRIPMGRLDDGMTSNVGTITGGEATNVVPDLCTIQGEVRAFHQSEIDTHLELVHSVFSRTAAERGGKLKFEVAEDFRPFVLEEHSAVYNMTVDMLQTLELDPHGIVYFGGSDANMLNVAGLPSVNLGIGAQNPHANDEFILIEDLERAAEMAGELIRRSNTGSYKGARPW